MIKVHFCSVTVNSTTVIFSCVVIKGTADNFTVNSCAVEVYSSTVVGKVAKEVRTHNCTVFTAPVDCSTVHVCVIERSVTFNITVNESDVH